MEMDFAKNQWTKFPVVRRYYGVRAQHPSPAGCVSIWCQIRWGYASHYTMYMCRQIHRCYILVSKSCTHIPYNRLTDETPMQTPYFANVIHFEFRTALLLYIYCWHPHFDAGYMAGWPNTAGDEFSCALFVPCTMRVFTCIGVGLPGNPFWWFAAFAVVYMGQTPISGQTTMHASLYWANALPRTHISNRSIRCIYSNVKHICDADAKPVGKNAIIELENAYRAEVRRGK